MRKTKRVEARWKAGDKQNSKVKKKKRREKPMYIGYKEGKKEKGNREYKINKHSQ